MIHATIFHMQPNPLACQPRAGDFSSRGCVTKHHSCSCTADEPQCTPYCTTVLHLSLGAPFCEFKWAVSYCPTGLSKKSRFLEVEVINFGGQITSLTSVAVVCCATPSDQQNATVLQGPPSASRPSPAAVG